MLRAIGQDNPAHRLHKGGKIVKLGSPFMQ